MEFICGHFINTPDSCSKAVPALLDEEDSIGMVIILVLILSILIMIGLICYVRIKVKSGVMREMKDEVGGIIAQYRQFKDRADTTLEMN